MEVTGFQMVLGKLYNYIFWFTNTADPINKFPVTELDVHILPRILFPQISAWLLALLWSSLSLNINIFRDNLHLSQRITYIFQPFSTFLFSSHPYLFSSTYCYLLWEAQPFWGLFLKSICWLADGRESGLFTTVFSNPWVVTDLKALMKGYQRL